MRLKTLVYTKGNKIPVDIGQVFCLYVHIQNTIRMGSITCRLLLVHGVYTIVQAQYLGEN
ncbi:hypothetical protein KUL150_06720 [Alteromonas sp. KUL150]|nr:hypothetical protein KUL150_06720 [Alteromonas sp. KUL150]